MFQSSPRWCPCGCDSSYIFEYAGSIAPLKGGNLFYTCPGSGDLLSFQSRGHWVTSQQSGKRRAVNVSLKG